MSGFTSLGEEFDRLFITDSEIIDRYVGNYALGMGQNNYGQLGDNTRVNKSTPVQLTGGGANWKQVASGYWHAAAIKTDGTLWSWGRNAIGQLGDNTRVDKSTPVQISGGGTNWKQVTCGYDYTTAIKTDGTLWTWGYNYEGQLGDNTLVPKSTPVQISGGGTNWKQVSGTTAIKTDGTLWSWGLNYFGQLGIGSTANTSTPVQVTGGGTNWKQVSGGYDHTAAIKTDGTLWTWGYNNYGELGIGITGTGKSTPVQVSGGGTNWKQVSCGGLHTVAIKTNGTLWSWGYNTSGQLGDNTIVNKSTPVQVSGSGTNWKQVSDGGLHTTAIKTDGTLWTWGNNNFGGLGDNTLVNKSFPIQPTNSQGLNWVDISAGQAGTIGLISNY